MLGCDDAQVLSQHSPCLSPVGFPAHAGLFISPDRKSGTWQELHQDVEKAVEPFLKTAEIRKKHTICLYWPESGEANTAAVRLNNYSVGSSFHRIHLLFCAFVPGNPLL